LKGEELKPQLKRQARKGGSEDGSVS